MYVDNNICTLAHYTLVSLTAFVLLDVRSTGFLGVYECPESFGDCGAIPMNSGTGTVEMVSASVIKPHQQR